MLVSHIALASDTSGVFSIPSFPIADGAFHLTAYPTLYPPCETELTVVPPITGCSTPGFNGWADLEFSAYVDQLVTTPGGSFTLTMELTNKGPDTAEFIEIRNTMEYSNSQTTWERLDWESTHGFINFWSGQKWLINALPVGETATARIVIKMPTYADEFAEFRIGVSSVLQDDPDSDTYPSVPNPLEDDEDVVLVYPFATNDMAVFGFTTAEICAGDVYAGQFWTEDTLLIHAIPMSGFDSLLTTDLNVLSSFEKHDTLELQAGMDFNGIPVFSDTVFVENLLAANGCDSTLFTHIMVFTSTDDLWEKEIGLHIYPNPTSGEFFIEIDLLEAMELEVAAVDMLGRNVGVLQTKKLFPKGKQTLPLKSGLLKKGTYFIQVSDGERQVFRKLIKM